MKNYERAENCITPCYVFDESEMKRRITTIRESLPDGVVLCFAMKANPFVIKAACDEAELLEVCSEGE